MADSSPASAVHVSDGRALLTGYLNKRMRVLVSDGRVIDGNFLCTDRDRNIVLGNCEEFFSLEEVAAVEEAGPKSKSRQPRTLGLAIIPGEHINSITIAREFPTLSINTTSAVTHTTSYSGHGVASYPDQEAASFPVHEASTHTTTSSSNTSVSENY